MNTKKTVLALIVLALAFSIGFVTFKAAELFKSFLISSKADCSRSYDARNCSNSREVPYPDRPVR
jgi:hypothetical protein